MRTVRLLGLQTDLFADFSSSSVEDISVHALVNFAAREADFITVRPQCV